MGKSARGIWAICISLLLTGCWGHSFPDSNMFIRPVEETVSAAETVHVFVDANGTFYPSDWDSKMGKPRSWKADSLLNESADDSEFRRLIEKGEREQLAQLMQFGQDRQRIFILVHGYNNTQQEALGAFRMIEKRINARVDDGIIRFYWDGLTGQGIGGGKIWFNATGYSQLAGSRGLRRILDSFANKEIYLISHSRGASVILSAIGNPVYDPGFLAATKTVASTWGAEYRDLITPRPLADNGNTLHILALAPAVDRIDFCDVSEQPQNPGRIYCEKLRDLGTVSSFRYTVNPEDPVLNKFVGLSGGFNPTGLGINTSVGHELAENYPMLQSYPLPMGNKFHKFERYVESAAFTEMIDDAGLLEGRH
jgi:hypothetical protein